MNENKIILKIKNVCFSIGKKKLLKNVSFNVCSNSVHLLAGSNGAGKTTLIKTILDAYPKTSGNIIFNGYDNTSKKWRDNIGYIPEAYKYQNRKIKKILKENYELMGFSKLYYEKRLDWYCKTLFDIKPLLNHKSRNLSSGQKKQIMIFDALFNDPNILIFDEPTENLDPENRIILFGWLRKWIKSNKQNTLLISSHVLTELSDFCNYMTIIEKGEIVKTQKLSNKKKDLEKIYIKFYKKFHEKQRKNI